MREPLDTIPDPAETPEEKFDDFWKETAEKWGFNQEKFASLKEDARLKKTLKESVEDEERPTLPEMVLNDEGEIIDTVITTRDELARELMLLVVEEAIIKIRSFDFREIKVNANKRHVADAVTYSFGAICEKYNLLFRISLENNSFTILKKEGIDYTGQVMDPEDGYVFHSLLNNYPNRVTIK